MKTTISPHQIPQVREWSGERLSPVQEVFMFHEDSGPVPETYRRLREALERQGIDHVVIGAFALAAHRLRRATNDVDICVRANDLEKFRQNLVGRIYQRVEGRQRRFYDPKTQVTFDLLVSGRIAGRRDKNKDVRFPDPSEAVIIEGLKTVPLDRLIALKLVTWRRQDWADVIALIRENKLDESFAQRVPGFLRSAYLQCHHEMIEEDRYEQDLDREDE
jgi:hypothetical protein